MNFTQEDKNLHLFFLKNIDALLFAVYNDILKA